MAWFKVSTSFPDSPHAVSLSDAALGYWLRIGCWIAKHEFGEDTIPDPVITYLLAGRRKSVLAELIDHGFLVPAEGGYRFTRSYYGQDDAAPHAWAVETTPPSRRKIPDDLRRAIYERDGYACLVCSSSDDLTLDHIHPWSLGGADTSDNLRTLCRPCNSAKGARV